MDHNSIMDKKSRLHLKKCSYRNCRNANRYTNNITYYAFPVQDPDRCIEWMVNSGCDDFADLDDEILAKKYICNIHFANTCFFAPRLIKTAVPDLYQDDDSDEEQDNKAPNAEPQNEVSSPSSGSNKKQSLTDGTDGTSQKLSEENIHQEEVSDKTSNTIVDSPIENTESCTDKAEYSQEKCLQTKQKKNCKYVTIRKLQISSLQDAYYKLDQNKHGILRMDALAQLLSYSDVQSEGLYLLYNSGSQGLPVAAMLNRIGANTKGHLIHLHPENMTQNFMVQAMNFPTEQLDRLINVNIYIFLRLYYQDNNGTSKNIVSKINNSATTIKETKSILSNVNNQNLKGGEYIHLVGVGPLQPESSKSKKKKDAKSITKYTNILKRKINESDEKIVTAKKPKWLLEAKCAVHLLQNSKARSLTIVAKEHPLNIVNALLPFLGISRPFVIYHAHREPLQETYFHLKQKQNVINLRFFSNFLRSYTVLPDRTYPDTMTSDTDGYLLTGYLVE